MQGSKRLVFVVAGLVCFATISAAGVGLATASPGSTTWTGYLYEGPGYHYLVTDEVPQASSLDVASCANGWCQVTFGERRGYMPMEIVMRSDVSTPADAVLAQPAAALIPNPSVECFRANQTGGNGGNALTSFCKK